MRDIMNSRKQRKDVPRAQLNAAWYVDADKTYDVHISRAAFGSSRIAVRTLAGEGHMTLADGSEFSLPANSLGVFHSSHVVRYFTVADKWEFYWFEYDGESCPNRADIIPMSAQELVELERCFTHLGGESKHEYLISDSLFNYLLADWTLRAADTGKKQAILALLERGRREKITIAQLAKEAGMCERSFRSAVTEATGLSPKAYMLKCEMAAAMELLRTTDMTISEIAACLNYSTPFYFSRTFKSHFGVSPNQVRFNIRL